LVKSDYKRDLTDEPVDGHAVIRPVAGRPTRPTRGAVGAD